MNNKLIVKIVNNYGTEMLQPLCDSSKLIVKLLGTKNITMTNAVILKRLGYEFEIKQSVI